MKESIYKRSTEFKTFVIRLSRHVYLGYLVCKFLQLTLHPALYNFVEVYRKKAYRRLASFLENMHRMSCSVPVISIRSLNENISLCVDSYILS